MYMLTRNDKRPQKSVAHAHYLKRKDYDSVLSFVLKDRRKTRSENGYCPSPCVPSQPLSCMVLQCVVNAVSLLEGPRYYNKIYMHVSAYIFTIEQELV